MQSVGQLHKIKLVLCPECYSLGCRRPEHLKRLQLTTNKISFYWCENCNVKFGSYYPVFECPACGADQVQFII